MSNRKTGRNRPKRPLSAYNYFIKEETRTQKGNLAIWGKRCAEKWNSMNEKEKQKYVTKANLDSRRYQLEKKKFVAKKKQGRKNAFLIYYLSQFSKVKNENPTLKISEIAKIISKNWKELDATEKERYKQMAALENSKNSKKAPTMKVAKTKHTQRNHHHQLVLSASLPLDDMLGNEDIDFLEELDEII